MVLPPARQNVLQAGLCHLLKDQHTALHVAENLQSLQIGRKALKYVYNFSLTTGRIPVFKKMARTEFFSLLLIRIFRGQYLKVRKNTREDLGVLLFGRGKTIYKKSQARVNKGLRDRLVLFNHHRERSRGLKDKHTRSQVYHPSPSSLFLALKQPLKQPLKVRGR